MTTFTVYHYQQASICDFVTMMVTNESAYHFLC